MDYGSRIDLLGQYRQAATYVDLILKGSNPGDLPVQAPDRYRFIINLKTAKMLGLTIPRPPERALLRARCQGPRPLPAMLRNCPETPSAMSAARRRRGVFHWRQKAARSRKRTQRVRAISTSGVSQKPK